MSTEYPWAIALKSSFIRGSCLVIILLFKAIFLYPVNVKILSILCCDSTVFVLNPNPHVFTSVPTVGSKAPLVALAISKDFSRTLSK